MGDKEYFQLPAATLPLSGSELVAIVQGGVSKQCPVSAIGSSSQNAAATPTFSPIAGSYGGSQLVTITSSTPGAILYYTLDGSTPTTSSTLYTVPLAVFATETVNAIATAPGFSTSGVGSSLYLITPNPTGTNVAAGGAAIFSYEGFPWSQDRFREGRFNCDFTGSITSGVMTITVATFNLLAAGQRITANSPTDNYTYIVSQLSGTTGGTGTYQLNNGGLTVGAGGISVYQPMDAAGWPTTDFQYVLYEGQTAIPAWSSAGTGKYACGFTSHGSGTETVTGNNCTISNKVVVGNLVTFDLQVTSAIPSFSVTGTTGGATDIFIWLPAYRQAAYSATTQLTTEALNHYKTFGHLRFMHAQNAWFNTGFALPFTAQLAGGSATSGTLISPFPFTSGTYLYIFSCTGSQVPDVRSVTMINGSTAVSWTGGALVNNTTSMFHPNTSQTRRTAANTKCYQNWHGQGMDREGFPADWFADFAILCNTTYYACVPMNDDGSWTSSFGAMLASKYAAHPQLKIKVEFGNENWNGTPAFNGSSAALQALQAHNSLSGGQQLATIIHAGATNITAGAGATFFNNQMQLILAWQNGNFSGTFQAAIAYYGTQGWSLTNDVKYLSTAPYFKTLDIGNSCTASLATSGILTVTAAPFPNIVVGATVTGAGVSAGCIITAQLTGTPFGIGTYQTNTTGLTVGSEAMTTGIDPNSSIAQIQSYLTISAAYAFKFGATENLCALALANGLKQASYEGGWDTASEPTSFLNSGAAIMDVGHVAAMNTYFTAAYNHGLHEYCHFISGLNDGTADNRLPFDQFGPESIFPPTTSNSPRYASLQNFTTRPVATFNVVSGSGSVIAGGNYGDNYANNGGYNTIPLGNFTLGNQGPHFQTGYCTYLINCTAPGTYALVVTFSGTAASPVTNVEVNGTVLATGTAVSNAAVALGNVTLIAGPNYVTLGHNGGQTATINQLQFN